MIARPFLGEAPPVVFVAVAAGGKQIRTLGPSRGQNVVGARLSGDLGCAAAIPGGTMAAVSLMSLIVVPRTRRGFLGYRTPPCSGCARNFRSRHLIPGRA